MNMAFKICNFKHEPECRVLYRLLNHSVEYTSQLLAGWKPHLQSSYTLWSTALPRVDTRSTRLS